MNPSDLPLAQPFPRTSEATTVETLLAQLNNDLGNWGLRKSLAVRYYESGKYLDAADVLWNAPEMPATDMDVAFAVKIVSRARPNRAIRLIYEVLRRNVGKPTKHLAIARAMNMIGLPMQAARFYGAAVAESAEHFDLSFEKQSLWFDDSGSLLEQWEKSDQEAKPPLAAPLQYFAEEIIEFSQLTEDVQTPQDAVAEVPAAATSVNPLMTAAPVTKPLLAPAKPALGGAPVVPAGASAVSQAASLVQAKQGAPMVRPLAPATPASTAPLQVPPSTSLPQNPNILRPGQVSPVQNKPAATEAIQQPMTPPQPMMPPAPEQPTTGAPMMKVTPKLPPMQQGLFSSATAPPVPVLRARKPEDETES